MNLLRRLRPLAEPAPDDVMTTTEVMWFIGYKTPRATGNWLRRMGVQAVKRNPGLRGENCYPRNQVEDAKQRMVGRGHRTDLDMKSSGEQ